MGTDGHLHVAVTLLFRYGSDPKIRGIDVCCNDAHTSPCQSSVCDWMFGDAIIIHLVSISAGDVKRHRAGE